MNQSTKVMASFVILRLGVQRIAIATDYMREILDPMVEKRVPGAHPAVRSLINVRGAVVPVADLRLPLGIPIPPDGPSSRIVVINVKIDDDDVVAAIRTDAVHEVTNVDASRIEQLPSTASTWPREFVSGIYRDNEGFVLVPNLETIFAALAASTAHA